MLTTGARILRAMGGTHGTEATGPVLALLRGVNVGGRARVPMAELRDVAAGLGLSDVRTYLQSGNLLFTAPGARPVEDLRHELEGAIATAFGAGTPVILRTRDELAAAVAANPFPEVEREPARLHVAFLAEAPAADRAAGLDRRRFDPDVFDVRGREVYIHYAEGAGKSKLTLDFLERGLGAAATARNWNTVTKLLAMMTR